VRVFFDFGSCPPPHRSRIVRFLKNVFQDVSVQNEIHVSSLCDFSFFVKTTETRDFSFSKCPNSKPSISHIGSQYTIVVFSEDFISPNLCCGEFMLIRLCLFCPRYCPNSPCPCQCSCSCSCQPTNDWHDTSQASCELTMESLPLFLRSHPLFKESIVWCMSPLFPSVEKRIRRISSIVYGSESRRIVDGIALVDEFIFKIFFYIDFQRTGAELHPSAPEPELQLG